MALALIRARNHPHESAIEQVSVVSLVCGLFKTPGSDVPFGSRAVILATSKSSRLCLRQETSTTPATLVAICRWATSQAWPDQSGRQLEAACIGAKFGPE